MFTGILQKLVRAVNAKSPINIKTGSEVALTQVSGQGHTDIAFRLDRHRSMRDIVKEIGREKYSKGNKLKNYLGLKA